MLLDSRVAYPDLEYAMVTAEAAMREMRRAGVTNTFSKPPARGGGGKELPKRTSLDSSSTHTSTKRRKPRSLYINDKYIVYLRRALKMLKEQEVSMDSLFPLS